MDYRNWQEIYKNMSPEMKEQAMKMAKAQIKEKLARWFSQPILAIAALFLGAIVGTLTAFFGQVLQRVNDIRDMHPVYWIPALALAGVVIVFTYKKIGKGTERGMGLVFDAAHGNERKIPLRLIPLIMAATWITHLFGGSSGREGVAMQIGADADRRHARAQHQLENPGRKRSPHLAYRRHGGRLRGPVPDPDGRHRHLA